MVSLLPDKGFLEINFSVNVLRILNSLSFRKFGTSIMSCIMIIVLYSNYREIFSSNFFILGIRLVPIPCKIVLKIGLVNHGQNLYLWTFL